MGNFIEERRCERCNKIYVAKASNQKYCTRCSNIINKEITKERDKIRRELRKKRKDKIYGKTETKD